MTSQQQPPPYAGFQPLIGQPAPYPQQPGYPPQPYPQQTGYPGYPPQPGMVLPQQQGYPGGTPNPGFSMGFVPPPPMHPSMSSHIAITPPNGNPDDDVPKYETGEWRGFSDKAIRAVFVRKVYAILMLQLAFTLGIICLFVFVQPIKWFVRTHVFVYYISYAIFMGVYISLVCCSSTRRKYPTNIILLSVFTMAMSYMLGTISCFHDTKVVLMAVGICAAVCLAVSLFSFHTKFDFTSCGGPCNFLQSGKTGLDIMRTSDNGSSFQSIFVNSSYAQQVPKQSYCHYRDQPPVGNGEITEKLSSTTFPILPPIRSLHPGKSIIPDQRAHMVQSSSQSTYGGNIYHESTNCSHEAITGNKPSIMNLSQETTYATSRPKQSGNGQMASNTQQQRSVATTNSKGKAKKSKHSTAQLLDGSSNKTLNFNANASSINFNLFTVPDLSCGKSNISHVPNSYSKHNTQPIISVSIDSNNQQTKLPDPMLGSVMHHTFNPALHQQNENVLNLNFQAPVYSEAPLPMPPPSLPLSSPCTTNPKMARTFPNTSHHPIRNFNLSNILPDMGNPMNSSSNSSSVKFQPSAAVPQSHQELHSNMSTAILSAPHQSCASSLYPPPHPAAAVPSPVSSVLNHCHSSITSCSQPSAQNLDTRLIPKPPNPTPPFRNIVHTLPFP